MCCNRHLHVCHCIYAHKRLLEWKWMEKIVYYEMSVNLYLFPENKFTIIVDLLRRLSKSQNTVFCGRIQLFLSRLFPLAEKSGKRFIYYTVVKKYENWKGLEFDRKKRQQKYIHVHVYIEIWRLRRETNTHRIQWPKHPA
jgi:hypothetical protein